MNPPWYFRKELFTSFPNIIFKFLSPLLGGLGLWFVFFVTIRDSADPEYSGSSIFGVGTVLVLGLGLILLGVVVMLIMRARQPAFFRGETLNRGTPSLIIPE